jgi:hypothetical protein
MLQLAGPPQSTPASGSASVPQLRDVGLAAQPQRGGEFDRQFEWTSELRAANMSYFKNATFRGSQEQVCAVRARSDSSSS